MPRGARLLDLDPGLADGLGNHEVQAAQRQLVVRVERIATGAHEMPRSIFGADRGIGLLIVGGLAVRRVALAHRAAAELLGPQDVMRPFQDDEEHSVHPFGASLRVLEALDVAVLDAAFTTRLAPFPTITGELVGRALARSRRSIGALVIAQLPSVDQRLLVTMWHFADRWGHVRTDGILLPLAVTHEILGLLVAARRPSVTAALGRLALRHAVVPQPEGGWLLRGDPPEELGPRPRGPRRATAPTIAGDAL